MNSSTQYLDKSVWWHMLDMHGLVWLDMVLGFISFLIVGPVCMVADSIEILSQLRHLRRVEEEVEDNEEENTDSG